MPISPSDGVFGGKFDNSIEVFSAHSAGFCFAAESVGSAQMDEQITDAAKTSA
jgi:hypothetical protein